jgi:signal transduction histidine kinase
VDAQVEGRKAVAERNALLSLAAILTHDLSNPLQSITVLCELGIEDDDPAEAPRRAEQSLQAAERMRDLLHAYAALVRNVDRPTKLAVALERTAAMFRRRCERHRITLSMGIERDFEGPRATGLGLVSLFLGMIRVAEENTGPFEANVVVDGPTTTVTLLDAEGAVVAWPDEVIGRIDDALADEGSAAFDGGTVEIRLESPKS